MAEMAMKEYKVYLKEVNWWSTTVTAACEEDAKDRAKEEHEYRETFEDYEEGHAAGHDSSLEFLTEILILPLPWHRRAAETCRQSSSSRTARYTFR